MSDKPYISKISVEISQSGNTLGTTKEIERLELIGEYQSPGLKDMEINGPFFVIKTEGWSIDSAKDLEKLIDIVSQSEYDIRERLKSAKD